MVQQKLTWVKSDINGKTFFEHWTADILFLNLKGPHPLNSIKLVLAFNDHKLALIYLISACCKNL
jgi:hypothetical protein